VLTFRFGEAGSAGLYTGVGVPGGIRTRDMLLRLSSTSTDSVPLGKGVMMCLRFLEPVAFELQGLAVLRDDADHLFRRAVRDSNPGHSD
jgi:hypothetical protein